MALEAVFNQVATVQKHGPASHPRRPPPMQTNRRKRYFEHTPEPKTSGVVMIREDRPESVYASPTISSTTSLPTPLVHSETPTLITGPSASNVPSPLFVFDPAPVNTAPVTNKTATVDVPSSTSSVDPSHLITQPAEDVTMNELVALPGMGPDADDLFNFDTEIDTNADYVSI